MDCGRTKCNGSTITVLFCLILLVLATGAFAANVHPTAPTAIAVTPSPAYVTSDLVAAASGSVDTDHSPNPSLIYQYAWRKSTDGGAHYGAWTPFSSSSTLDHITYPSLKGYYWQVKAKAYDGQDFSPEYQNPTPIVIADSAPTAPTAVSISPTSPLTADDLTASASGSGDADSDSYSYEYRWYNGGTLTAYTGETLPNAATIRGETWTVEARAVNSGGNSAWVASAAVTIGNTAPTAPTAVSINPGSPLTGDALTANASGASDADAADTISWKYQWYKNGTLVPALTAQTVPAGTALKGEQWTVQVCASDGTLDSVYVASSAVTIGNTAPTAPTAVSITPGSPLVGGALTANASGASDADAADTISWKYQWYKNGTLVPALTGDTVPAGTVLKGEQWTVQVCASDGTLDSVYVASAAVTVGDTAPTAPTVVLTPASPLTANDLVCTASGSSDADNDGITYEYRWYNGATLTAYTDATLPNAATTKGEQWKVEARAVAGGANSAWVASATVTIGDTAPTAPTVVLTPASPQTADDLVCTASGSSDADNDATSYEYRWSKLVDGTWTATADTGSTLPNAATATGEQWRVEARCAAGGLYSDWVASATVTIGATAPTVPTVVISPAAPLTTDNLVASATGSSHADSVGVSYEYKWYKWDGTAWADAGIATATVDQSLTSKGEQWKAAARAVAGGAYSDWMQSASVTIGNTAPTAPARISLRPNPVRTGQSVTATATGASDADNDTFTYKYQWEKSADGAVWTAIAAGRVLAGSAVVRGDHWRCKAKANDGSALGAWTTSAEIIIADGLPTAPTSVTITPANPTGTRNLVAAATGATDPENDALTYRYQWSYSADGGATWNAGPNGRFLDKALLVAGSQWKVLARANDGTYSGPGTFSSPVTIGSAGTSPALVATASAAGTNSGATQLTVNLTSAASVEVHITNIAGYEVATLAPQSLPAGVSTLFWNGRSNNGTQVPGGRYTAQIKASAANGSATSASAVISK